MSAELEPMQESIAPFDYSQLDEQTAQALQNYAFRALQVARTYYRDLMEIVVGAHELLCGSVVPVGDNGRFIAKEDTFRAWCASVRINKTKAYQLLQIHDFMDTCTPEEQSTLALLPFTAMRELVTGDTPEQVITMAKEGKVGTSKEVLELKAQLKAQKDRADTAEAQRDAAQADVTGLTEQNAKLQQSYHDADESRIAANLQRQKAEAERDRAEARAKDAENALKKQPITSVVDKDEVKRQADAMSRKAVQEARQQAAEAQARLRQYQEDAEGLLAPAQACAQQAQFIADSVRAMYLNWLGSAVATDASLAQMGTPLYAVCGEIMSSLEEENTINPTAAGSEEDAEREALFE